MNTVKQTVKHVVYQESDKVFRSNEMDDFIIHPQENGYYKTEIRTLFNHLKDNNRMHIPVIGVDIFDTTSGDVLKDTVYFNGFPKKGHKFMVTGPTNIKWFSAIKKYNEEVGSISGNQILIRFSIIDPSESNDTIEQRQAIDSVSCPKKMDLVLSTEIFSRPIGKTTPQAASSYLMVDSEAKNHHMMLFGTDEYDDATVRCILIFQGKNTRKEILKYKTGEFGSFIAQLNQNLSKVQSFVQGLNQATNNRIELNSPFVCRIASFFKKEVIDNGNKIGFDETRTLDYLSNPQAHNEVFGGFCQKCGHHLPGFADRMLIAGTAKAKGDTWTKIIQDIQSQPLY